MSRNHGGMHNLSKYTEACVNRSVIKLEYIYIPEHEAILLQKNEKLSLLLK